jgi:hypothetical protein
MYGSDDSSDSDSGTSYKRGKKSKLEENARSPRKESHKRHSNPERISSSLRRERSDQRLKTSKSTHDDRKRHRDDTNSEDKRRHAEDDDRKRAAAHHRSDIIDERKSRRSGEREYIKISSNSSSSHKESSVRQRSRSRERNLDRYEDLRKKRSHSPDARRREIDERRRDNEIRTKRSHSNEKRHDSRKESQKTPNLDIKLKSIKRRDNQTPPPPSLRVHPRIERGEEPRRGMEKKPDGKRSPPKIHSRDHSRHASLERKRKAEDDYDAYGPALPPPSKLKSPEKRVHAGPQLPASSKEKTAARTFGPILPKDFKPREKANDDDEEENYDRISSEDDDVIGPVFKNTMSEQELELEKRKIQLKIEALDRRQEQITDQREEWMIELPKVRMVTDLGLGARQFRTGNQPDFSDRTSWTKTPNDGAQKSRNEAEDHKRSTEKRRHDEAIAKRDAEQEAVARKHKKMHKRDKSLLELHEKKLKKEKVSPS